MLSVSMCAAENFPIQGNHVSMWATGAPNGGRDEVVPEMNIERHQWYDEVNELTFLVYAIHTSRGIDEPAWGHCPQVAVPSTLIIPCAPYYASEDNPDDWNLPETTARVTEWLQKTRDEKSARSRNYAIGISVGVLAIVLCAVGIARFYRRRQRARKRGDFGSLDCSGFATPRSTAYTHTTPNNEQDILDSDILSLQSSAGGQVMSVLMGDENLWQHRLVFNQIVFQRMLNCGAFGEVWLCRYAEQTIAVKRFPQTKATKYKDVEAFVEEIQLTAALQHQNIVRFVGIAWNSLENLCMALEYLANGDLHTCLHRRKLPLRWTLEKRRIARDIACGLGYLHSRNPPLLHRDIKSKNILLSEELDAKIVDFGVSRDLRKDQGMTAGVGTPYWTAPEVLEGTSYSEKSDVYSFGVVLVELDTERPPFAEESEGARRVESLQPFQILKYVIAGDMRPTPSPTCPPDILELITECLRREPETRPNIRDVYAKLDLSIPEDA